jgi:hypothetical protein
MMSTFGERVKMFNRTLSLRVRLPEGISVMNPFRESALALRISDAFYNKYYGDDGERYLILGINPGRFGAALSGVPFTDFKRLEQYCGISAEGQRAHEPSSEFVYAMIASFSTVPEFYRRFYINSVCPLGFIIQKDKGRVNYNYYDDPELYRVVKPFILRCIRRQIALGCSTDECFCLGVKNGSYLSAFNEEHCFFKKITVLPHPRFIVQYRRKEMAAAIETYKSALGAVL